MPLRSWHTPILVGLVAQAAACCLCRCGRAVLALYVAGYSLDCVVLPPLCAHSFFQDLCCCQPSVPFDRSLGWWVSPQQCAASRGSGWPLLQAS